jgi:hypothetical protein
MTQHEMAVAEDRVVVVVPLGQQPVPVQGEQQSRQDKVMPAAEDNTVLDPGKMVVVVVELVPLVQHRLALGQVHWQQQVQAAPGY